MTPEQIRAVLGRIGGLPPDQDPFNEMIRQHIARQGVPVDPKALQDAIDKIRGDKALMDRLERMAREQQATGKPPNPAEMEKALRNLPIKDLPPPKDFVLPKEFVPPKQAGRQAPQTPPEFEPPRGNPNPPPPKFPPAGRGGPNGPAIPDAPPPPVRGGGRPPDFGTKGSQPGKRGEPQIGPPLVDGSRSFDPRDPFSNPQHAHREQAMRAAAALWEKNVGPLDETPTVRRLLFDLVAGTDDITDGQGNNLWDALGKETGDGSSFGDWFDKSGGGEGWKLPSLDMGSTSVGRWWNSSGAKSSGWDWSSGGSSGSSGLSGSGGLGFGGLEGTWLPVVLLAAVLLGGLIWWRFWYLRDPVRSGWEPPEGLGPWPLDPRHITTREDLVRAFEYLSVLICGMEARTWTHGTIAQALAGLAATHGEIALLLARLYELARYAPLDEPLTREELAEARDIVCQLAGVRSA
jgi:hypothetical protein